MLDQNKIAETRKRLVAEKERLVLDMKEKSADFGSDVDDLSEEGDEAEEFANETAAHQALRDRVSEIDSVLLRMDDGTFGKCEKCGMDIEDEELDKMPERTLCRHCGKT